MPTLVIPQESQEVRLPPWVVDLASFRRWATSDDFPTSGWYSFLAGEIWADPSMERAAHNLLKTEFARALGGLIKSANLGHFFGDRMLLTNEPADLSTEPDGMFLSHAGIKAGRVRIEQGDDTLEVQGSPDVVLEIVSPNSRRKDTVVLRDLYWKAGVREYWLVEQTRQALSFAILTRDENGFVSAERKGDGCWSAVLGRWFTLDGVVGESGVSVYTVESSDAP